MGVLRRFLPACVHQLGLWRVAALQPGGWQADLARMLFRHTWLLHGETLGGLQLGADARLCLRQMLRDRQFPALQRSTHVAERHASLREPSPGLNVCASVLDALGHMPA